MLLNSILCIGLTVVTLTFGNELNGDEPQEDAPDKGDASYEFGYDIHNPVSNDIKSHHEIRDGKNVLGFYTFKEADGSIRIVKYKVGPTTGFEAVVERLPPDPLSGNSIDGQEASPSTHGVPQTVSEPNGGHNSRYVAGVTETHSSGNRNQHGNERNNVQVYPNRNPSIDSDRRYHEPQQNYPGRRHRDPYIIRRNLQYRNNQHLYENGQKPQYSDQRFVPQEQYIGAPRGRQRNQFINPNIIQPNVPYTNNIVQPSAYGNEEIIYIDGIPYINDVGAYYDSQGQLHIPNQEQTQNPPYQVEEKPESSKTEEQATENDSTDNEEYEEDDDDVEDDHAEYEEEDDEDDDEDVDASDFFEQNQKLADKQKEEYDKLKRAYEEEGQVTEENEEEKEQQKTETAPQDDSQQQI